MTTAMRGAALLAVQAVLVLSTAGKYEWERHARPMVWVQVSPFGNFAGPEKKLSGDGRYAEVQLYVDACGLSTADATEEVEYGVDGVFNVGGTPKKHRVLNIQVRTIAKDGKLVAVDARNVHSSDVQKITWDMRLPCTYARLPDIIELYVPKGIDLPLTLKPDQTVWALVTVPQSGPPRPVQLAVSDATGFHPLVRK